MLARPCRGSIIRESEVRGNLRGIQQVPVDGRGLDAMTTTNWEVPIARPASGVPVTRFSLHAPCGSLKVTSRSRRLSEPGPVAAVVHNRHCDLEFASGPPLPDLCRSVAARQLAPRREQCVAHLPLTRLLLITHGNKTWPGRQSRALQVPAGPALPAELPATPASPARPYPPQCCLRHASRQPA